MLLYPVMLPVLFLLVFPCCVHAAEAGDSLSSGQSLAGNQTLVSKEGNFELGFFSPGESYNLYLGIWFKKIPKKTVVWVANREAPILDPSTTELRISENGNLVLVNQYSKNLVWQSNSSIHTNSSAMDSYTAVLLDTGNLILRRQADSSSVIWESFDHLTDSWLPGGWVGLNKVTGGYQYLRSWRNVEDPAPGLFSYHIDEGGSSQFFLRWNGSVSYWGTGVWTGQFTTMPEVKSSSHFNFSYVDDGQRRGYTYTVRRNFGTTRATLDPTGRIDLLMWLPDADDWQQVWAQPIARCGVYSVCGPFSICNERSLTLCECLQGFEPVNEKDWKLGDWSGGCARQTHSRCSNSNNNNHPNGGKDGFLAVPGLRWPAGSLAMAVKSRKECELVCLEDCSCTAYAYASRCLVWKGELRIAQKLYDGDSSGRSALYVRMPSSELRSSTSENRTAYGVIIGMITLGVTLLIVAVSGLLCIIVRRRSYEKLRLAEGSLISFTYANLRHITNNFSEKLGGGGFGSVFRGTLPDSTVVAVKRLEGPSQGEKQFCTEVRTLGTIHHVNLIQLHGFCAQGAKKLLVYEYMPNGSLDNHLFGRSSSTPNWNLRYQIILGVARGLVYLHEKCRESIIHCDIKPENILLDAEFQPKIADFGLAKLLGKDFSRVLTTMRGTIGYLAPEWLSGLPITPKADVYSYGMLVLEIISGRRNTHKVESMGINYFPLWAAFKLNEGEVLGLLDERLEGAGDAELLARACKAACWCIQGCEHHRPTMRQVIQILEGVLEVNTPPVPRSLQHIVEDESSTSFSFTEHTSTVPS